MRQSELRWVRPGSSGGDRSGYWLPATVVGAGTALAVFRGRKHLVAQSDAHEEWGPNEGNRRWGVGRWGRSRRADRCGRIGGRRVGNAGAAIADRLPGPPALWTVATAGTAAGATVVAGS